MLLMTGLLVLAACGDGGDNGGPIGAPEGGEDGGGEAPKGNPIIFGMDEDSTGPGASYSRLAGQMVRDAIDEVNRQGGILDRPVKLIVENDESDPTRTPAVTRNLIDQGADVLIMQTGGSAIQQSKPVIQQAQVLTIAPTTLTSTLAEPPDNDFMFTLANPIDDFASIYTKAFDKAGIRRLGIFADASPTIDGLNKLFLPLLQQGGIEIVAQETASVDAADVTAQVQRLQDADPDAILATSVGGQIEVLFHNTAAEQASDIPRFSLASIGNQPETWDLARADALDGLVFMASVTEKNPRTADLIDFLHKNQGQDAALVAYHAQAYDSVYLLKRAIESAGGVDDPMKLKQGMESVTDYDAHFGQSGFKLAFGADKHVGTTGLCGLILVEFEGNEPGDAWSKYQPEC
jgi:branched-chain amino acid transport system substrate-binding protein